MKYSEYILDYLDGTLDYEKESELFGELAANGELRREMSDQLLMARSIDTELHELAPSHDLSANLFDKMGFTGSGKPKPLPLFFPRGNMFRNLLSGLVGCAITAILFLIFLPVGHFAYPEEPVLSVNIQAAPVELPASVTQSLGKEETESLSKRKIPVGAYNSEKSYSIQESNPSALDSEEKPEVKPIDNPGLNFSLQLPARFENANQPGTAMIIYPNERTDLSNSKEIFSTLPGFAFVHRNIINRSIGNVPASLAGKKTDFLSDRAFGAEIRVAEGHFAGVEIGRENYFLEYESGASNGKIIHRQNPDLFWGGIYYKYVPPTGNDIKPYIRGFAGATSVGPVGRLSGGLNYRPFGSFLNLFIEAEASNLFFQYQGRNFNSMNYGISYGVSISY